MIAHAHRSMNRSQRLLALAASLSLAIVGVLAQVTLAAAARQDADKKEEPQAVEIKTVAQDAGVIKKVQIDAPGGDRDPSTLLNVLEMQGHPMTEGSLTDQETIASAWKATVERNIVTAQQLNLSLPEGSKLKAVIWGDRVTITRDEAKSQIAAANGRIELIDADGVRRVTLRAAAPATNLALTASIENGEVAFVASSPDKNATLRLDFDRTTGVPENEEQPPHGAVRYDIQPAKDDEDKPTRLKMQWIYDVSKLREQANALQLQRRIDEVQFQAVLVDATVMITADVRSIRRALPSPITIPAPEKDDE